MMLFFGAQANKVGQDFTWEYFKQNVNKLIEIYGKILRNLYLKVY